MGLWEFAAVMDGLQRFHGGGKSEPAGMTEAQLAELEIEGFV